MSPRFPNGWSGKDFIPPARSNYRANFPVAAGSLTFLRPIGWALFESSCLMTKWNRFVNSTRLPSEASLTFRRLKSLASLPVSSPGEACSTTCRTTHWSSRSNPNRWKRPPNVLSSEAPAPTSCSAWTKSSSSRHGFHWRPPAHWRRAISTTAGQCRSSRSSDSVATSAKSGWTSNE